MRGVISRRDAKTSTLTLGARSDPRSGVMSEEHGPGYEICVRPHYAWVQRLFSTIPGARGYLRREKLREADVLIRRYVASRIDEAVSRIDEARGVVAAGAAEEFFSSIPTLTPTGPRRGESLSRYSRLLEQLSLEAQRLSSDILYADAGWAPVSAVQAIREEQLLKLCEIDDTLIGLAEAIAAKAVELLDAAKRGDSSRLEKLAGELAEAISAARRVYEERSRFLRFAGPGEPGLLERARRLISKLLGR